MPSLPPRVLIMLGATAVVGVLSATAIAAQPGGLGGLMVQPPAPVYTAAPAAPSSVHAAVEGAEVVAVDPAWAATMAGKAGIPIPAVRAYAVATLRLSSEDPGCNLGWTTLAGVGYVESLHGTIDERLLHEDGHSSTPILGPALDGKGDFAAVPASPTSAQWHGDVDWDHAVGPLQFMPSSWSTWHSDGDGDGVADPNDLDDAAYAAGRYLCASGSLATGDGWGAAIFSYNHSDEYVRSVYDAASAYAARTN